MKCGACLPHCPTYAFAREEAEGPRGRVALVQGLAHGDLAPDAVLAAHLDACLGCRACEPVCPARVPIVAIVDEGRARLAAAGWRPAPATRILRALATRPAARRSAAAVLRMAQALGLIALLARLLPRLRTLRLAAALPRIAVADAPPATAAPGAVRLFLGCHARHLDAATLAATGRVYARLGIALATPADQVCCGALAEHSGAPAVAATLRAGNGRAFAGDTPVLCTATGCQAELTRSSAAPVSDVCADLAARPWTLTTPARAEPLRVVVHTPCSARQGPTPQASLALLARLPGVEVLPVSAAVCCGMGGANGLAQPGQADALGAGLARALLASRPDLVVSANWSCALGLRAALGAAGRSDLEVVHPVVLVDRLQGGPGL